MVNKSDFISKKNFTIIYYYTRRKINHNSKMDCFLLCFPFNNLKKMAQNGIVQDQILFLEKNPDIDVCYGPTLVTKIPNETFEFCKSDLVYPSLDGSLENLMRHNSPHCLPMWRKSIHERFGAFDTSYFSAADYDMWFRVLAGGGKIAPIEETVGLYYQNPKGISTNPASLDRAIKEVLSVRDKYK
jgi:hypothetical protein